MPRNSVLTALRSHAARVKRAAPSIRILIVDDEPQVRTFVDHVLRDAGYSTATAADGHEALRKAAELGTFDLVVTDVRMPRMSGPSLVQKLRRTERDVKVLYLTAYNDQLFREKITLWEDEAFLDKPYTVKALLEAVSLLLHGHVVPIAESTPS